MFQLTVALAGFLPFLVTPPFPTLTRAAMARRGWIQDGYEVEILQDGKSYDLPVKQHSLDMTTGQPTTGSRLVE